MANTDFNTFAPAVKKERVDKSQIMGLIPGDYFERENFTSAPTHGSIPFNSPIATEAVVNVAGDALRTAGSVTGDLLHEAFGLFKDVVIGEQTPTTGAENNQQTVAAGDKATENISDAKVAFNIQIVRKNIEDLKNGLSMEQYQQKANEAFRLNKKTITQVTAEAKAEGFQDPTSTYALMGLAAKGREIEQEIEENQEAAEANGIQRIAGADIKRNFEDQNMNIPG